MNSTKRRILILVFLLVSIGNYYRIAPVSTVSSVEWLSIFTIGLMSGLLLQEISDMIKNKRPL